VAVVRFGSRSKGSFAVVASVDFSEARWFMG
jgi:hypothetical protein